MNPLIVTQAAFWAAASTMLVVWPGEILGWFDLQRMPTQYALARLFGAELWGLTIVSYLTRRIASTPRFKDLGLAYGVSNTLGAAITIGAMIDNTMGRFSWVLAALYVIYAAGFGYYLLFHQRPAEQRTHRNSRDESGIP